MKYAIYVEGQAEMLFVADVLQKYSEYDRNKIGFKCITLVADIYEKIKYPEQDNKDAENYYQIVNVNNDDKVISKLNRDIPNLLNQGFQIIVGLKDVYGKAYELLCKNAVVDRPLIERLYTKQSQNIESRNADVRLHFSIMEYEAWMLALIGNYIQIKGKTIPEVEEALSLDLSQDFEETVYHPTSKVKAIFDLLGEKYGKHEGNDRSFLSSLTKEDYEILRISGRSASFSKFMDSLFGNQKPALP